MMMDCSESMKRSMVMPIDVIRIHRVCLLCAAIFSMISMKAENQMIQTWDQLASFAVRQQGSAGSRQEYRIPIMMPDFEVKELIPSWNIVAGKGDLMTIEAMVTFRDETTRSYQFGRWATGRQSLGGETGTRTSLNDQKDDYAAVYTDTLMFKRKPIACTLKLTLSSASQDPLPTLKLVGVCLSGESDGAFIDEFLTDQKAPIELDVPKRCQFDYIGGRVWCSPTSVTMILGYWANILHRPELEYPVPTVADRIFDPGWPGTGNWPFNTAFAGEHAGLRAFVARLDSVDALYEILSQGIPVATSVSYDLLKGKPEKGKNDGHLVVCIGFGADGNPVFNDPARCPEVRWSYPMEHFSKAWQSSKRTVYLILPEDRRLVLQNMRLF
jgi:hypothetical protein